MGNNVEEATKPVASPNVKPAAQPTNAETAPSNSTSNSTSEQNQQQFLDLERWNALKQKQAQQRIIEHLMYSGRPEEEPQQPTARKRLAHKVKNKTQKTGGDKG